MRREEDPRVCCLEDETIPRGGSAAQNGVSERRLRVLDVVIALLLFFPVDVAPPLDDDVSTKGNTTTIRVPVFDCTFHFLVQLRSKVPDHEVFHQSVYSFVRFFARFLVVYGS